MSSPQRIPAPTPAFTVPGNTHDTYPPMPSPYSRTAAPTRIYPYTTSPWQPTSPCNLAARPIRPPSPEDVRPTDNYDIRPPPPSPPPPPPLLNAGVDAASLHPPRPSGALVPRPQPPTHPSTHPLRTPGSTALALDKPPLSFPDPPTPKERHSVSAARRRRKKATTARIIAVAEAASLFARTIEQSLQKQNSKHVSTTRLLAAQLASESGKRPASPSTATPKPAPADRFRALFLVSSSSRYPTDLAAGPALSAPGTSIHSADTARHRGQPPIRDRPRPSPPSTKNATVTPNASFPTAPVTTNWLYHSSDSGEFTPKSPSVSPLGQHTRSSIAQTAVPPPTSGRQSITMPPPGSAPLRCPLVRFPLVMPAPLGMRHKEALYISHGPPEPVADLPWVGSGELRRNNTSRPAQRSSDSD
jgi:hypothetical protein